MASETACGSSCLTTLGHLQWSIPSKDDFSLNVVKPLDKVTFRGKSKNDACVEY
jgi:hypothetical protein